MQQGEEYLHLPAIVDAAESSPAAAREASIAIRRFISKEFATRAYAQYNAIMLMRILTDNPGRLFTKNFDAKFNSTCKELLREGRDMSVQQILRETLDFFENEKSRENDSLLPIVEMWRKEKAKQNQKQYGNTAVGRTFNRIAVRSADFSQGPPAIGVPAYVNGGPNGNYFGRDHRRPRGLPAPDELAARIEEARTTARLLLQTIQSTPNSELLGNELVKEFADRAASASRSIQGYINCQDPSPDDDTMMTLIETNEQLSIAQTKHQRSMLQARKAAAGGTSPQPQAPGQSSYVSQPGANVYSPQQIAPPHGKYMTPEQAPPESPYAPSNGVAARSQYHPHAQGLTYSPPSGPPPQALGARRSPTTGSPPPVPSRNRPLSQAAPQVALNYGNNDNSLENPFSDPNEPHTQSNPAYRPPPSPSRESDRYSTSTGIGMYDAATPVSAFPPNSIQQTPTSATGGMPRYVYGSEPHERLQQLQQHDVPQPQNQYEMYAPPGGPPPTQVQQRTSYQNRQDSATNNITMHGVSPLPEEQRERGAGGTGEPASPGDGLSRRMGDMRV